MKACFKGRNFLGYRAAVVCFAAVVLAACGTPEGAMPSTREKSQELSLAINKRFDTFDIGEAANRTGAAVVGVYKDAVEKDLGYSFDDTVRETILLNDENRYLPLAKAINAIEADPVQFLDAGLISQRTGRLAAAAYRFEARGFRQLMVDPEIVAFVALVDQCQHEQPNRPWCAPEDLRRLVTRSTPDQDLSDDFIYETYIWRAATTLANAGWLVGIDGSAIDSAKSDVLRAPFTWNYKVRSYDTQLWGTFQKERETLEVTPGSAN